MAKTTKTTTQATTTQVEATSAPLIVRPSGLALWKLREGVDDVVSNNWSAKIVGTHAHGSSCFRKDAERKARDAFWLKDEFENQKELEAAGQARTFYFCETCVIERIDKGDKPKRRTAEQKVELAAKVEKMVGEPSVDKVEFGNEVVAGLDFTPPAVEEDLTVELDLSSAWKALEEGVGAVDASTGEVVTSEPLAPKAKGRTPEQKAARKLADQKRAAARKAAQGK